MDVARGGRADEAVARHAGSLEPGDRRFLMELAYGTVRWRKRLDWHLDQLLPRGVRSLPADLRAVLELGAYQLLFMDGVPARAAVHESVELARGADLPPWAPGLANGVLRSLDRERGTLPLPDPSDCAQRLAVESSHPKWMVERWLRAHGPEATASLLARNNVPRAVHLAVNPLRATRAEALERLAAAGVAAIPHPLVEGAIVLGPGAAPDRLPGWAEGWLWAQDAGAQAVAALADLPEGGRLLDAFAAPGGKLAGLLARSPDARALALDLDPGRLARVAENLARLGLDARAGVAAADVRAVPTRATFDVVLADVPCSGTGVLARRADARWRRRRRDLDRFAAFQRAALDALADRVAPGGALLYATCSIEPEENQDVVAAFLEERPAFRLEPAAARVPDALRDGPFLFARPWVADVDGMFAARLVRDAGTA